MALTLYDMCDAVDSCTQLYAILQNETWSIYLNDWKATKINGRRFLLEMEVSMLQCFNVQVPMKCNRCNFDLIYFQQKQHDSRHCFDFNFRGKTYNAGNLSWHQNTSIVYSSKNHSHVHSNRNSSCLNKIYNTVCMRFNNTLYSVHTGLLFRFVLRCNTPHFVRK